MPSPSLALIGCGAIAESYYLPALQNRSELVSSLLLVDPDTERIERIRKTVRAVSTNADYRDVLGRVDGVIVATPHHLHTPITLEAIRHGVHVLCEKPISATTAEVDAIIAASSEAGTLVTVNHTRRLYASLQEVHDLVKGGAIGELQHIKCSMGGAFSWPAATNSYFGTAAGGHGVLFDFGPHVLDVVCWLMGGQPELVSYTDDSDGGTEAVAKLELRFGSATASIHFSWLSALDNKYRVTGSDGVLEGDILDGSIYQSRGANGRTTTVRADKARDFVFYAEKILKNFTEAIAGREKLIVSAEDVRPSVALIEECYENRSRFDAPWYEACRRLSLA